MSDYSVLVPKLPTDAKVEEVKSYFSARYPFRIVDVRRHCRVFRAFPAVTVLCRL